MSTSVLTLFILRLEPVRLQNTFQALGPRGVSARRLCSKENTYRYILDVYTFMYTHTYALIHV